MDEYSSLVSRLNNVSSLLVQNPDKLVPFDRLTLRTELGDAAKATPSLNLTISGLSDIFGIAALPQTLGDVVANLAKLNLAGVVNDLKNLAGNVASFAGQQISVGLSFLSVLQSISDEGRRAAIAMAVEGAYKNYFFGENGGYKTLEGAIISPPTLAPESSAQITIGDLRALLPQKTADQFIRKLLQVTGEATGDVLFDLPPRYDRLKQRSNDKELRWFQGFATLAESTVTSAVEEALLGASTFTTNPLFAASVSTFAGTSARKATQHAFLEEVGISRG
jgi:hypothetical protein